MGGTALSITRHAGAGTRAAGGRPIAITSSCATIALGVVGSFIGGLLGYAIFHKGSNQGAFQPSGIIGSIIGAVIALLVYRAVTHRRSLRSGTRAGY